MFSADICLCIIASVRAAQETGKGVGGVTVDKTMAGDESSLPTAEHDLEGVLFVGWIGLVLSVGGTMLWMPVVLRPAMSLGLRTRSNVPCPNLPYSPSPQLNTSPEAANAKVGPLPAFDDDS